MPSTATQSVAASSIVCLRVYTSFQNNNRHSIRIEHAPISSPFDFVFVGRVTFQVTESSTLMKSSVQTSENILQSF